MLITAVLLATVSANAVDKGGKAPDIVMVDEGCVLVVSRLEGGKPQATPSKTPNFYVCDRTGPQSARCIIGTKGGGAMKGGGKTATVPMVVIADESPVLILKSEDMLNMVVIDFSKGRFGWAQMMADPVGGILQKQCSGTATTGAALASSK